MRPRMDPGQLAGLGIDLPESFGVRALGGIDG